MNSNPNSIEHDGIDKIGVEGGHPPAQNMFKTLIGALVNGDESGVDMAKQTTEVSFFKHFYFGRRIIITNKNFQLINLSIALMNALKQSFTQRAQRARSFGGKDKFTDLSLAAIDMGKVS